MNIVVMKVVSQKGGRVSLCRDAMLTSKTEAEVCKKNLPLEQDEVKTFELKGYNYCKRRVITLLSHMQASQRIYVKVHLC